MTKLYNPDQVYGHLTGTLDTLAELVGGDPKYAPRSWGDVAGRAAMLLRALDALAPVVEKLAAARTEDEDDALNEELAAARASGASFDERKLIYDRARTRRLEGDTKLAEELAAAKSRPAKRRALQRARGRVQNADYAESRLAEAREAVAGLVKFAEKLA